MDIEGTQSVSIHCPYCGEPLDMIVDCSVEAQRYIEDCQVCCRPIEMAVYIGADGTPRVSAAQEDDA